MRIANKWSEVSLKQYIEIADINAIDMDVLENKSRYYPSFQIHPKILFVK